MLKHKWNEVCVRLLVMEPCGLDMKSRAILKRCERRRGIPRCTKTRLVRSSDDGVMLHDTRVFDHGAIRSNFLQDSLTIGCLSSAWISVYTKWM